MIKIERKEEIMMVVIDKKSMISFQQPYRPTSNSGSLVITLPKMFTDLLSITKHTRLMVRLGQNGNSLVIEKLKEDVLNS